MLSQRCRHIQYGLIIKYTRTLNPFIDAYQIILPVLCCCYSLVHILLHTAICISTKENQSKTAMEKIIGHSNIIIENTFDTCEIKGKTTRLTLRKHTPFSGSNSIGDLLYKWQCSSGSGSSSNPKCFTQTSGTSSSLIKSHFTELHTLNGKLGNKKRTVTRQ